MLIYACSHTRTHTHTPTAPIAFKAAGIGKEGRITSYPTFAGELQEAGYTHVHQRVLHSCVDGHAAIITSQGPGTAFEFALAIIGVLLGEEVQKRVQAQLLWAA